MGFNTPTACADTVERLQKAYAARTGRKVATYGLFMIITGETDAEAKAKWDLYKAGADHEALAWLTQQSSADTKSAGRHQRAPHVVRSQQRQPQYRPAAAAPTPRWRA